MIFKRERIQVQNEYFVHFKTIELKGKEHFSAISMEFYFKNAKGSAKRETILFAKSDQIFEYNFDLDTTRLLYKFKAQLNRQP